MLLLLTVLLAPTAAHADCPAPSTPEGFGAALREADDALGINNISDFQTALVKAELYLPCVDAPISREQAALWSRLKSTRALMRGHEAEALRHLQASLALQGEPGGATLEPAQEGWWYVDGARTTAIPPYPYILQRADAEGRIVETRYIDEPSADAVSVPLPAAPPALPSAPSSVVSTGPVFSPGPSFSPPDAVKRRPDRKRLLLGVAGGLALTSGALYYGANSTSQQFYDLNTTQSELDALRQRTNVLVAASAVAGAGALGATGAALVVAW